MNLVSQFRVFSQAGSCKTTASSPKNMLAYTSSAIRGGRCQAVSPTQASASARRNARSIASGIRKAATLVCIPLCFACGSRQLRSGGAQRALNPGSSSRSSIACQAAAAPAVEASVKEFSDQGVNKRLDFLVEQACDALDTSVANFKHVLFPCALIAGDVVILHLLHKQGLLQSGRVKIVFVDTLHLFPETITFLREVEERYGFKALYYTPKDFATYEEYAAVHGTDLPEKDIGEYDKICKVEPFARSLKENECDLMINGRRRDHGAERAHLTLFDVGGQGSANCQPIAYWEFEDCFTYAEREGFTLHPLHDKGYPSLGDTHSTIPIDREKWFEYGAERSGRFQGYKNADGSSKTECGEVEALSKDKLETLAAGERDKDTMLVMYAPWCQFCQGMEPAYTEYAKAAAGDDLRVAKYQADVDKDFAMTLGLKTYPTIIMLPKGKEGYVKYESEERTPEAWSTWKDSVVA